MSSSTMTDEAAKKLDALTQHATEWARVPLAEKRDLLLALHERVGRDAERWVSEACRAKGTSVDSTLAGEEWLSGPFAVLQYVRALAETVGRLAAGGNPLDKVRIRRRPDGRLVLRALPYDASDRAFLNGFAADVWLPPGVTEEQARERLGRRMRDEQPAEGVALVLGAGNVNATPPLDVLYQLYSGNSVVLCKLNPVNDYLQPLLEEAFAPFIERGFVAFVSGGADIGAYLIGHDTVTGIHLTGSNGAHDAIVFGSGEEGARRKTERKPVLRKPISSELGGVGATVILPGPWSKADLRYQAAHIATQKLHNSGFNCTASQVVVLPDGWHLADAFLAELKSALRAAPQRSPYYPGATDRISAARQAHPEAEDVGGQTPRLLITGLDPDATDEPMFQVECFAPVHGVTRLPGAGAREFLEAAVPFCNERLAGTLGVNLIAHPKTIAELGGSFDDALVELRFGTIAINTWTSLGYLTPRVNWGAFPGHELHDVGSGIGLSHNALLLDDVERTVVRGPFRPAPRSLLNREWSLMPMPPWFLNNKRGHHTSRLATRFAAKPSLRRMLAIGFSAIRS